MDLTMQYLKHVVLKGGEIDDIDYSRPYILINYGGDAIARINIESLSYSITREMAPVYTMGSPDQRSFQRGKRGIAGSFVLQRPIDISEIQSLTVGVNVAKGYGLSSANPEANSITFENVEIMEMRADMNGMFTHTFVARELKNNISMGESV